MKISKYILTIFLFNGFFVHSQSLKEYRWENRIIILVSQREDSEAFRKQHEALSKEESGLEDRDLVLLLLTEDSVELPDGKESQIDGNILRKELKTNPEFEGVILIGKDGGIKMREKFHVESQKILDLIDSMPMRRQR